MHSRYSHLRTQGFTLIELMVVVAIVSILALFVMTTVFEGRKSSRDTVRVNELSQLKLGVRLYKEAHGSYPQYDGGVELGVGEPIDAELAPFVASLRGDPLSEDGGGDYEYWYFSNFECGGEIHNVIFARSVEIDRNSNYDEVCGGGGSSFNFEPDGFIKRAHAGGGYSQGSYYSQGTYYSQSTYYAQTTYYAQSAYAAEAAYYTQGSYASYESWMDSSYILIIN